MSDTIKLPPCRLCGQIPHYHISANTWCDSTACVLYRLPMSFDEWRRLHGQRLAPEHVDVLREMIAYPGLRDVWTVRNERLAAIRAALTALGEDNHV